MKEEITKLDGQLKIVGTVLAVIVIIVLLIHNATSKSRFDTMLNDLLSKEYSGVVTAKYIDKENHNDPSIILSGHHKLSFYGQYWDKIQVGDSLVKKKGSGILEIYNQKGVNLIDLQKEIKIGRAHV